MFMARYEFVSGKFHKLLVLFFASAFSLSAMGQDLLEERIRKIDGRKKSVYYAQGIIHGGGQASFVNLKSVRHSYAADRGHERVVFDFEGTEVPRIYGHISTENRMLYMDFFNTHLTRPPSSLRGARYISSLNFFPIDQDKLSLELGFKEDVSVEVFYLTGPPRLVVDIRK